MANIKQIVSTPVEPRMYWSSKHNTWYGTTSDGKEIYVSEFLYGTYDGQLLHDGTEYPVSNPDFWQKKASTTIHIIVDGTLEQAGAFFNWSFGDN